MVSIETLWALALSFPETSEQPHFEKTSFRVGKKIFVTLNESKRIACVKLSETDQDVFCLGDNPAMVPVPNKWGKQGWTNIYLDKVHDDMLTDVVKLSYKNAAVKKNPKSKIPNPK
ncbi:MAG: MmcQ/YjbR family DNA-binding protein [Sphingobacteriaceae bacterium]|nr:MAG: MmcQ/YjbR family DNA-binding protein [Sphingobacteriaceae bacterium]